MNSYVWKQILSTEQATTNTNKQQRTRTPVPHGTSSAGTASQSRTNSCRRSRGGGCRSCARKAAAPHRLAFCALCDAGFSRGQLAIKIKDGEYANEVVAFPQPGVEYCSVDPVRELASAIATAATTMSAEAASSRRERQAQRRHIETTSEHLSIQTSAVDALQQRLATEREVQRLRADELSAQEQSLVDQQNELSKKFAVAMAQLTSERQTLADTREELLASLEKAQQAVTSATAEQAMTLKEQREAIERRLAEVKREQERKKEEERHEKEMHSRRIADLEALIRDKRERSRGREDAVISAIEKIGARMGRLEQQVLTLQQAPAPAQPGTVPRTTHKSSKLDSDSDSDDAAATDEDDPVSCSRAIARWTKRERQLASSEKATGPYSSLSLPTDSFVTEWRRRLSDPPRHMKEIVENTIELLTHAHKSAVLVQTAQSYVLRYSVHEQLRLVIGNAGRLQLRLAGTLKSAAYAKLDSELKLARMKNRRGKAAFVGHDSIITTICGNEKLQRPPPRNESFRGRGRGGRGGGRGNRGPQSVDSETPESVTSRESVKPYRGRR